MSIQEQLPSKHDPRPPRFRWKFTTHPSATSVTSETEKQKRNNYSARLPILETLLCTLLALIVILALILFTPLIEVVLSSSNYVKIKEFHDFGAYEQWIISRLINEKSIISVDDLWSMQVSFYQTIVSLLIGINASVLAVAFLIIRSSSNKEAIREAAEQIRIYTESPAFTKLVTKKSKKEINKLHAQYNDSMDSFENVHERHKELEQLVKCQQDKIDAIVSRLSLLDNSEEDPGSGRIT